MHPSLSNSDQLGRRPDFITTTTGYFRWTTSIWPLPLPRLRRGAILALGFAGVVLASIPGLQAAPAVGVPITWGRTLDGQLGNGTGGTDINATQNVAGLVDTTGVLAGKSITAVSMGTQYCLALDSNGKIYSWGTNGDYDLGTTSVTVGSGYTTTPVAVDMTGVLSGKTVTAISAGITESMALTSDGKVYTWGNRTTLGDGTSNASAVPVAVDMTGALSGKTVTAIATGGDFCMVLTSEGKVYTWGANTNGQLGNNTNGLYDQYSFIPVPVDTSGVLAGKTVTAIAAGEGHALVLTSDNKLFSWGGVAHALGAGSSVALAANGGSNGPVAVDMSGVLNGRTVVQIAAGQNFSVALTSDGKVFTWGDEGNGNLGNGTRGYDSSQYVPVAVDMTGVLAGLSVTHISCGYQSVVVQASDGKLYAWGDNTYGQLGYTGVSEADTPLAVDTSGVLSNYTVTALGTGGGGNDRSVVVIGVANTVVAPAISTQPVSQTVTAGSSVTFSVAATGTPLSYQWQKGGVAIAGATSSSFIIASTSAGDAGSYTVVVSNSAGNVTSIAATLTVNPLIVAPTIITQPTSQTVTTGNSVTFSVTATGTSPTYQWQKGGVAISGATSSSFTIASTSSGDAGTYTVVVSNTAGNVTSNGATLTLTASVVAPSITAQPSSQTVTAGNTVTFNVTANGTSLSYQWQKGGVAIAGATGSSLNFTAGTSDAGIYTVVVSNSAGSVTSSAATLTVNTSIA
ncbi:MAG TPA: immunoglobulin domain-containing protein, partial [Opitutaceae bacterium]